MTIKNAILSVYDKSNILTLAHALVAKNIQIYSTGGTYKMLTNSNIPVTAIDSYTNFPEVLSGRVKTLHPNVHAGILARRHNQNDMKQVDTHHIVLFDLVCINLYPFEDFIQNNQNSPTFLSESLEMIDIGGPTMIRAAAKNYPDVCVLTNALQYNEFIQRLNDNTIKNEYRYALAKQAFSTTAHYDSIIEQFFQDPSSKSPLDADDTIQLRYGENPHQKASIQFYGDDSKQIWRQLHGKELSYNNLLDLDSALHLSAEFSETVCAILKHTNPCGVALHSDIAIAVERAIACDPISYFGGVVICNQPVNKTVAELLHQAFIELIIAPSYSEEAYSILSSKANIRLLEYIPENINFHIMHQKSTLFGTLRQDCDQLLFNEIEAKIVTKQQPTTSILDELKFAFQIVKHVKSNAIILVKGLQVIGIGAGQMNRIASVELALHNAKKNGHSSEGSVMASDAFFPFDDCVHIAGEYGIKSIIQPGGSLKDNMSIKAADHHGISMIFTNMRHFRH